ncbi:unnamed protein product, partial [Cylicocyclus nassatus]
MTAAGQLVSEWMLPEKVVKLLQRGDLLEFRRVAPIRGAPRNIYDHWAVYIGQFENEPLVIHLSGNGEDFATSSGIGSGGLLSLSGSSNILKSGKAEVRCDPLFDVAGQSLVRINNGLDANHRPFPPTIVVDRALLQLGARNYNLFLNNCEHFVNWCRYGIRISS